MILADGELIAWLIAGSVVVVGVILIATWLHEKKRREAFAWRTQELGYEFDPQAGEVMHAPFSTLPLFSQGHGRRARNLLRGGRRDDEHWIFDYRYARGGGKNKQIYHQTVIAFPTRQVDLPAFSVRPENIFHKIGSAFGYQDIDIDEHPDFSNRYLLHGSDEDAIRALFDGNVIRTLDDARNLCVEAERDWLIAYRARRRVSPQQIREFVDEMRRVRKAFIGH